jgi:SAM-dependent methyltransferase
MTSMQRDSAAHTVDGDWFASAFDALYPIVYAHRTVEAATAESAFAIEQLQISSTSTVLDLCCGNGRHMHHLLKGTSHVTGLDYSSDLLAIAREALGERGRLIRGDMRTIPFVSRFDAIANFFTSFGYFQSDGENLSVARGIRNALSDSGRFFMDYLNPEHVRASLVAESERIAEEYCIKERRWIDERTNRVNKITEVFRVAELVNRSSESVRLYDKDELRALLESVGLKVESMFGNYDGSSVAADRPRQIVVGTKG